MARIELRQTPRLSQTQRLILSPTLQQSLELLQLPSLELDRLIEAELSENPLLEIEQEEPSDDAPAADQPAEQPEDQPNETDQQSQEEDLEPRREDEKEDHLEFLEGLLETREERSGWAGEEQWRPEVASGETLSMHLLAQVLDMHPSPEVEEAARYIVYSLDTHGLLSMTGEELRAGWEGSPESLERALELVQSLEPVGVARFSVQEALTAQLLEKGHAPDSVACRIVAEFFDDLASHNWPRIARALGTTPHEVQKAVDEITGLNPYPGSDFAPDQNSTVIPDVIIEKIEGRFLAFLNDSRFPTLVISERNRRILESRTSPPEVKEYVREKYRRASFFLRSIDQRQQTVRRIAEFLAEYQQPFLEHGVEALKPLTLQQAAEALGCNQSTISRAINGKYVQSPQGVMEMRYFFSRGLPESEGVSTRTVKEELRRIVDSEDAAAPLSDEAIVRLLLARGFSVKRRTVANYRNQLGIPPARDRKRY